MEARLVACRMVAFLALLYAVYMGSIVVFGLGLYFGLFKGPGPFAITVVPAIFALLLIGIFLAMSLLPGDAERRITGWSGGSGRGAPIMAGVVTPPPRPLAACAWRSTSCATASGACSVPSPG